MSYDRDIIVQGVTRYYELLEKLAYIKGSEILRPPPTGWTDDQLQMDMLRATNRSERAIDLIRHLPYLRSDDELEVYPPCRIVSYLYADRDTDLPTYTSAQEFFHQRTMVCGEETISAPPGMVALASDLRIDAILLDTEEGVVYHCDGLLYEETAPESEPWRRDGKRYDAREFLDIIYEHVSSLLLIPVRGIFTSFLGGLTEEGQCVRKILTECGWPQELDKEKYKVALEAYQDEERRRIVEEAEEEE